MTLSRAMEIAKENLSNMMDENGDSYYDHAVRVMDKMDTEDEKIVAILHDVVEDTEMTLRDLQDNGFSRRVMEAVEMLTKRNDMTYFDYIDDIHCNELATKVKIAEIEDNKDVGRVKKMSFRTYTLDDRAKRALSILKDGNVQTDYK